MPAYPNLRTVVLQKQRSLDPHRRHHTHPTKPRVPLVNKIRIGALDQRHRAARENEIVVDIEKRPASAATLRRNDCKSGKAQSGNLIVADYFNVCAKRLEPFDDSLDMARRATRLCAGSRRRSKINNAGLRALR